MEVRSVCLMFLVCACLVVLQSMLGHWAVLTVQRGGSFGPGAYGFQFHSREGLLWTYSRPSFTGPFLCAKDTAKIEEGWIWANNVWVLI